MMGCYWWNRWWHRRKRVIDLQILEPAMRARVEEETDLFHARDTPAWRERVNRRLGFAWILHKSLPGNEHWRCQCSGRRADREGR